MSVTKTLSKDATAFDMPYVAKRTWLLTLNDSSASNKEAFFAIQPQLLDPTSLGSVVVETGHSNNPYNVIFVPYTGAIIPVCGIGYVSSGTDIYGSPVQTQNVLDVLAFGGNKVDMFI